MKTFLFGIAALALASPAAAAFIIDDFTEAAGVGTGWYLDPPAQSVTDAGLTSVLGGTRTVSADWGTSASLGADLELYTGARYNGPSGVLGYDAGIGNPFTMSVLYDAGGAGLGLDLSGNTAVSVLFDADHVGLGTTNLFELTLTDAGAASASSTIELGTGGYSLIDWTDLEFALSGFSGLDLTSVSSIELQYRGDYFNDARFDSISVVGGELAFTEQDVDDVVTAVPAAAPLALLAIGSLGLVGVRRRVTA